MEKTVQFNNLCPDWLICVTALTNEELVYMKQTWTRDRDRMKLASSKVIIIFYSRFLFLRNFSPFYFPPYFLFINFHSFLYLFCFQLILF